MFDYAFEILQQDEFWVRNKKFAKTATLSPVEAQNALNFIKKNAHEYRDSVLRWALTQTDIDEKQYVLVRDTPAIEFVKRQPLYIKLQQIANLTKEK